MKASEMIKQLEQLIIEHGDLPLAVLENDGLGYTYIESDGVDCVYRLGANDYFYNSDDEQVDVRKVFLLD